LYDVRPIDDGQSPQNPISVQPSYPKQTILNTFINGKVIFYKKANGFLHLLHSNTLTEPEVDAILSIVKSIGEEMGVCKQDIKHLESTLERESNDSFRSDPPNENALGRAESNLLFARFARMLLSLFAAKPYVIRYGPLRRHQASERVKEQLPKSVTR
jgi:hypothetical protein